MKIGIYDPYLDDLGGGEKYMMTIASSLSRGNEVTVFWNNRQDLDRISERFNLDLSKVEVRANIFSHSVSSIKRLFESKKYDVMIVLSDGSIPTVLSKKLFIHIQQPLPNVHPNFKTKLKMSRVSKVFCNSYFTKKFIDRQLGVDSIVIYPPVELHPKNEKKENIILHVGRFRAANIGIENYKKQDIMLEQFKKLEKDGLKKWKFILAVGVNSETENQFEDFKKSARGSSVEFLINLSNHDLWDVYSKAKIYWHASGYGEDIDKHPELAEHFGISTVEAMGAGAVPVVINAGGQKEIVEDNVSGFFWDTLDQLREKTLLLTEEDKIRETMSKQAVKRSHDFAGDRFADDIQKMIFG